MCARACACVCVFPPRAECPGLRLADRVNANRSCMPQSPRLHQCPATASTDTPAPPPPPPAPPSSFSFPLHRSLSAFLPSSLPCSALFQPVWLKLLHLWPGLPGVSPLLSFDARDHSALPARHPLIFFNNYTSTCSSPLIPLISVVCCPWSIRLIETTAQLSSQQSVVYVFSWLPMCFFFSDPTTNPFLFVFHFHLLLLFSSIIYSLRLPLVATVLSVLFHS